MRPVLKQRWLEHFWARGYPDACLIGQGMEGAVFALVPGERVAKVWTRRGEEDLRQLAAFYDALLARVDRLRTPQILDIERVGETTVSTERFLPGVPLDQVYGGAAMPADPTAIAAVVEVLEVLSRVGEVVQARQLGVLDATKPLWADATCWSEAIAALLDRRLAQFGDQLRQTVDDLGVIVEAIRTFLRTRNEVEMTVLHGDLIGANVLVDADLAPVSVLDFGFLTTIGDPAFDASIASATFDMYGPAAHQTDARVSAAVGDALGYERRVLLAYRAVYALLTSHAYDPEGDDGHAQWCNEMLGRGDVRAALKL